MLANAPKPKINVLDVTLELAKVNAVEETTFGDRNEYQTVFLGRYCA